MIVARTSGPHTNDLSSAYMDLEPQIRELVCMAALARYYILYSGLPFEEGQSAEAERVCFAISHIADMAEALEKAWGKALRWGEGVGT
jgi:hypothetical protein